MATQLRVPRSLRGYEHIIRDQPNYERIAGYIASTPLRGAYPSNWAEDEENPAWSILKPVNL